MSAALAQWIATEYMFAPPPPIRYPQVFLQDENIRPFYDDTAKALFEESKVPCVHVRHGNPKYLGVYFHGNNENLVTLVTRTKDEETNKEHLSKLELLSAKLEMELVALEYPGYYDKAGVYPTEAGCYAAVESFCAALNQISKLPVIYLGYSMGCALALHAAARLDCSAVVLLAPFVSAISTQWAKTPGMLALTPIWSSFDVFITKIDAKRNRHPLLVASGTADAVVPWTHGKTLSDIAGRFCVSVHLKVEGATHESIVTSPVVHHEVAAFLGANAPSAPGRRSTGSKAV
jgi:dienelactone hydrolase